MARPRRLEASPSLTGPESDSAEFFVELFQGWCEILLTAALAKFPGLVGIDRPQSLQQIACIGL